MLVSALAACDVPTSVPSPSASPSPTAAAECGRDEIAASRIDGTIVDPDGNPLPDIFVQLETGDGFRGTTRTTEEGTFTSIGASGEFVITTIDIDYEPITRRVSVECGQTLEVELVLTPVAE